MIMSVLILILCLWAFHQNRIPTITRALYTHACSKLSKHCQLPVTVNASMDAVSSSFPTPYSINFDDATNSLPYMNKCVALVKWAVLTTRDHRPSRAVIKLLDVTKDWCMLILGDHMSTIWWQASTQSNRIIYLPLQLQKLLPFHIVKITSLTSITRKNIGYLYAIKRGAEVILDLGEDNVPIQLNGSYFPVEESKHVFRRAMIAEDLYSTEVMSTRNITTVWNPYPHFGFIDSWPRGFPPSMSWIPTVSTRSRTVQMECYPIIQQYLANPDPVSLPFNRKDADKIVVPRAVFAPYDAQSTVHLYEAFWSLLLPNSVQKSMTDVARAYVTQSLFYLIPDACLLFTPPALTHEPNLLKAEYSVLHNLNKLIDHLYYLPLEFDTLQEALVKVYASLYDVGIVEKRDIALAHAWIQDLNNVHYIFPKTPVRARLWTNTIQLCVMFKFHPKASIVKILLAYYMRFFKDISLFVDGSWEEANFKFIQSSVKLRNCNSTDGKTRGGFHHRCLAKCLEETQSDPEGYLYIADDVLLNLVELETQQKSKLWCSAQRRFEDHVAASGKHKWPHWNKPSGYRAFKTIVSNLPKDWLHVLKNKHNLIPDIPKAASDVVYIPTSKAPKMLQVLHFMTRTADIFSELAIPMAVNIAASPEEQVVMNRKSYLWNGDRNLLRMRFTIKHNPFCHPVKLDQWHTGDLWREVMMKAFSHYAQLQ